MSNIKKYLIGFIIGLSLVGGIGYAGTNGSIGDLFDFEGPDGTVSGLNGANITKGTIASDKLQESLTFRKYLNIQDYDGGTNKTSIISRDGNTQFFGGGVVIGTYSNDDLGTIGNGKLQVGGNTYINSTSDVGLNENGALIIGNKDGLNIGIDTNEIMARNGGLASSLYIQNEGGLTKLGGELIISNPNIWDTHFNNGLDINNYITSGTGGSTHFRSDRDYIMEIEGSTKRVGIGTTGPREKLDVNGRLVVRLDPDSGDDVGNRDYNDARYALNDSGLFIGTTSTSYNGDMGGYVGANNKCNSNYSGSHICSVDEIFNTINNGGLSSLSGFESEYWIKTGNAKYLGAGVVPVNDCNGFKSSSVTGYYGNFWKGDNDKGGVGLATKCNATIKIACCK